MRARSKLSGPWRHPAVGHRLKLALIDINIVLPGLHETIRLCRIPRVCCRGKFSSLCLHPVLWRLLVEQSKRTERSAGQASVFYGGAAHCEVAAKLATPNCESHAGDSAGTRGYLLSCV